MDTEKITTTNGEPVEEQAPTIDPSKVYSIFIDKDVFEKISPWQIATLFKSVSDYILLEKPSYMADENFYISKRKDNKFEILVY